MRFFILFTVFCLSCAKHRLPVEDLKECEHVNPKEYCVTVEFSGGRLGNQLFEVATALSVAKDNHCTAVFPMLTESKYWSDMATYGFDARKLFLPYLNDQDNAIFSKQRLGQNRDASSLGCFTTILEEDPTLTRAQYLQKAAKSLPVRLMGADWKTLTRYLWFREIDWGGFKFWSYQNFDNHRQYIQDTLGPSVIQRQNLLKEIKSFGLDLNGKTTCSIHMRRGDRTRLLWRLWYPMVAKEYYQSALEKLDELLQKQNKTVDVYVVFSDDIAYGKSILAKYKQKRFFFIESEKHHLKDYEELWLMSLMTHNIIANSTFSFWGAYLNKNPNKIVVQPNKWYGLKASSQGISPPDWNTID